MEKCFDICQEKQTRIVCTWKLLYCSKMYLFTNTGTGWNIFEDTEQIAKEVDSLWSDASAGSWLARAQHYVTFTLLAKKWFVKCLHLTAERAEV